MSIQRCVRRNDRLTQKLFPVRLFPRTKIFLPISFLLLITAILMVPVPCRAKEPIIVATSLNQQKQGDRFVYPGEDGDFLVRVADLEAMGFQKLPGTGVRVDGDNYLSLKSIPGVHFTFDETTLTLEISADPKLLPEQVVDLGPVRKPDVIYPHDNSFFLNYGFVYAEGGDDSSTTEELSVSNELGARYRDILFLSDSLYNHNPGSSQYIRLNSRLIYDQRASLRRYTAGDFVATSGGLGGRVQMGGFSLSKVYSIDPYFINYPLFDFTGLLSLPSEVDLYLDGVKVQSERFSPGEFDLKNLQSFGGAQMVEVVIRDVLGREQRIISPFYFTNTILRRGLQEYSYNLGFLRQNFGEESNDYGNLAFSGFHRFGLTDVFNVGFQAEATDGLFNLGMGTTFKTGNFGVMQLQAALSTSHGTVSEASLIGYDFQSRNFRATLAFEAFSSGYRTLGNLREDNDYRPKQNIRAGIGYITPRLGSIGLDYFRKSAFEQSTWETLTLSWARRIFPKTYLNANFRQVRQEGTSYEGNVNLTWYFGRDRSLSAGYRHEGGTDYQTLEARQDVPTGEGTGWDVQGERSAKSGSQAYALDTSLQHNANHAILRGDLNLGHSEFAETQNLRLAISGALVHIGESFALTRPVRDSFALVSVGEAEGVRVLVNSQTIGRTNSRGRAIIPDLTSYYENQVSIEDKDIPIEYLMPRVRLYVSPSLRSGSCLNFPLRHYQAFTGTWLQDEPGRKPLANTELILATADGPLDFWTDGDGQFYFDNQQAMSDEDRFQGCSALEQGPAELLPAGTYSVTVKSNGKSYQAQLAIPESTSEVVDLGILTCRKLGQVEFPGSAIPAPEPPPANNLPDPGNAPLPTDTRGSGGSSSPSPPPASPPEPHDVVPVPSSAPPGSGSLKSPPAGANGGAGEIPERVVVHFPLNQAQPFPEELLQREEPVVKYLFAHPEWNFATEGYTCNPGSEP